MTLEVDKIVEAIITGQALDLDEAENVSRFVQASQSKFDLGVLAIGADHLSRYGRASRLMNLLEQMLLPDPDITLEELKKSFTTSQAEAMLERVRASMDDSFRIVKSLAKQPSVSSPEAMARNLNGAEATVSVGVQGVSRISPERRQHLRNIIELLAERVVVKTDPRELPAGLIKKKST